MAKRFKAFSSLAASYLLDPIIIFGCVINFLVWTAIILQIGWRQNDNAHQAAKDSANLARVIEETVSRHVRQIEALLSSIAKAALDQPDATQWSATLDRLPVETGLTVQMAVTDRNGMLIASTLPVASSKPIDLSDREHVRVHLEGLRSGLFISKPVLGRVSGRWSIQFSRALHLRNGTVDGVAVVSLDAAFLDRLHRDLHLSAGASIVLLGVDGIPRAAAGEAAGTVGRPIGHDGFARAVATTRNGAAAGMHWGDKRVFTTWRRIGTSELAIAFSEDARVINGHGDASENFLVRGGALISFLIALAMIMEARSKLGLAAARRTQAELEVYARRQAELHKATLDSIDQGVIMLDPNGSVVIASKRLAALMRTEADKHTDRSVGGAAIALLHAHCDYEPGKPATEQRTAICTLDYGIVLKIATFALSDGYVVATFEDITVLHRQHEALRAAEMTANAANNAKSAFLAQMSHEIRTPMNGIIGLTDLLVEADLPPENMAQAKTIATSAQALLSIINEVLDFSRIEADKIALSKAAFDLLGVVEDTAALLAPLADQKGIEVVVSYDPTLPERVFGDGNRIRQVVTNLIGNAIRFTNTGSISIEVRGRQEGDAVNVDLRVVDTGIGIPRDQLESIFAPFNQVDDGGAAGGTGLGLTISRRLTELMGGALTVDSSPGLGSTFRVSLPLTAVTGEAQTNRSTLDQRKRVLVVDPSPLALKSVRDQLNHWRHDVTTFSSHTAALDELATMRTTYRPFDVAIIDAVCARADDGALLKGLAACEHRPAVALMGSSLQRHEETHPILGDMTTLHKPVRRADLRRALGEQLARPTPVAVPTRTTEPLEVGTIDGPISILAVEDNATNREVLARLLQSEPVALTFAADGAEAVAAYSRDAFDLVLMDLWMPNMDGYEATARIRTIEKERGLDRTPIIALTANALRGDRERVLAADMDDYVSKPIRLKSLRHLLRHWGTKKGLHKNRRSIASAYQVDAAETLLQRSVATSVPVDRDFLKVLRDQIGSTALSQLVRIFAHECSSVSDEVKVAATRSATAETLGTLHSFSGSAACLGLTPLKLATDYLRLLMLQGERVPVSHLDRWHELLTDSREELQRSCTEICTEQDRLRSSAA